MWIRQQRSPDLILLCMSERHKMLMCLIKNVWNDTNSSPLTCISGHDQVSLSLLYAKASPGGTDTLFSHPEKKQTSSYKETRFNKKYLVCNVTTLKTEWFFLLEKQQVLITDYSIWKIWRLPSITCIIVQLSQTVRTNTCCLPEQVKEPEHIV